MNSQSYFYKCSPEYIESIAPDLQDQITKSISILSKKQTPYEINKDVFWTLNR